MFAEFGLGVWNTAPFFFLIQCHLQNGYLFDSVDYRILTNEKKSVEIKKTIYRQFSGRDERKHFLLSSVQYCMIFNFFTN